jgi:hypothetical protein
MVGSFLGMVVQGSGFFHPPFLETSGFHWKMGKKTSGHNAQLIKDPSWLASHFPATALQNRRDTKNFQLTMAAYSTPSLGVYGNMYGERGQRTEY